jgi:hypothetical protein
VYLVGFLCALAETKVHTTDDFLNSIANEEADCLVFIYANVSWFPLPPPPRSLYCLLLAVAPLLQKSPKIVRHISWTT